MGALRSLLVALVATLLLTLSVPVMAAVRLLALGGGRRFCAEVVTRGVGKICLWLAGVRVVLHQKAPFPAGQVIYTANHTSTLDLFLLLALGLPNTRYFMKRASWLFLPVGAVGALIGTFFTPPQTMPEARVRCFKAACERLRRARDSVYLSPEGTRVTTGEIGKFNKGTFHLATELKAPIIPLFFHIPREINPGKGLGTAPGEVHVYVLDAVDTAAWRLEDLEKNTAAVRQIYVEFLEGLGA